jgi:hypothetical protein
MKVEMMGRKKGKCRSEDRLIKNEDAGVDETRNI